MAHRLNLLCNRKPTIVRGDIAVSARAILMVEDSFGGLSWMECRLFECPDASVAVPAHMCNEWHSTVLIAVFAGCIAAFGSQTVHGKGDPANFMTMKLPMLTAAQAIGKGHLAVWEAS